MTPDWGGAGGRAVAPHELTRAERAWIERAVGVGATITSIEAMPPSATAKHRIEMRADEGSVLRLVLRRYDDTDRLDHDEAYGPANEAHALSVLEGSAVPAPRLYGADLAPDVFDVPAIVESWIPGASMWIPDDGDLGRFVRRSAEAMVAVHEVAADRSSLPAYRPYFEMDGAAMTAPSRNAQIWERALAIVVGDAPSTRRCFIHRDLHAGNVMWEDGYVSGVVDWATACWGPPGIDLARMRLNLAGDLGREAADAFTQAYVAAGGPEIDRHPYWDLLDAVDSVHGVDEPPEPSEREAIERLEDYVAHLVAELG